jgi:hypothetical protein
MNKLEMWDVAYCWPYAALGARYKQDSGDGDKDLTDFIDDLVGKWLPGALVHKVFFPETLDFTYAIEHEGRLLIAFLGTEGKFDEEGWRSDFSPQIETEEFLKRGGHVDFIKAGERLGKYFSDLVSDYRYNFYAVGISRGGARELAALRYWYRQMNAIPIRALPFCSPPVFTGSAADEYDKCGLGSVTIRPTMSHDPVDLLGLPILQHVGVELKLPDIETAAIKQHGLKGKLFYGHAYSSVFECLQKYCQDRHMKTEWQWLEDTKWVATV